MSKLRKYDIKNKRSFMIVIILVIVMVCIFSLFIYRYLKTDKISYTVSASSVVQDTDKTYMTTSTDYTLKVRWDGKYYLTDGDERTVLGSRVVVYDTVLGTLKLYGDFYEIKSDGKVVTLSDETVLDNTTENHFYKISDREYLLVGSSISTDDKSIDTGNYLLVELDKMGNAKLSNNKVNLKSISPIKLLTSSYSFDVAGEILKFNNMEIDLKKIIGSTNEYISDDDIEEEDSSNTGTSLISDMDTDKNGGNTIINNTEDKDLPSLEDAYGKARMTSVLRVVEGLTAIDVDYVVYDPYNEYNSVYIKIKGNGEENTISLDKSSTHVTLDNLEVDTDYTIHFGYTVISDSDGESEVVNYTVDEFSLHTKKPEYTINLVKLSLVYNTLSYKVNLQSGYDISKVKVSLEFSYQEYDAESNSLVSKTAQLEDTISVDNESYVRGEFDISGYAINEKSVIKLTVMSVNNGVKDIYIGTVNTSIFGG